MTKSTLLTRLSKMRVKAQGNVAKIEAINQCLTWAVQLKWAEMRAPVKQKMSDLAAIFVPLVDKECREGFTALSIQERDFRASSMAQHAIYKAFSDMIFTTAWNAEQEHSNRKSA